MFSYSCTYTFDVSFVCFAILNTIFKVKEDFVHFLKSFLNWRFTFFICLKNNYNNIKAVNFFLSHTQIHLYSHGYFFSLPQPFIRIFFTSKPTKQVSVSDSEKHKVPQLFLYVDCYFSQEHHKIA